MIKSQSLFIFLILIFILLSAVHSLSYDQGGAYPDFESDKGFAYLHDESTLYCIDISNRSLKWEYKPKLHFNLPENSNEFNFSGISDFVMFGDKILIGTLEGYLICINSVDGNPEWEYFLNHRIITKPIYKDKKIYFGTDGFKVCAFDTEKKDTTWTYHINNAIENLIVEDKVYFCAGDKRMWALNIDNGNYVWMTLNFVALPKTRPVFYKDNIYLGTTYGTVYNVKSENGGVYWRSEGSENYGQPCYPVIIDNHIIYKHIKEALVSFDIKKLEGKFRFDGDNILPETVIARDSTLYYLGDSKLYIANAVTGMYRQPIDLSIFNPGTPILIGQTLFVRNETSLYKVNFNREETDLIFDFGKESEQESKIVKMNIDNLKLLVANVTYPKYAYDNDIQGMVKFRCLMDSKGNIITKFCEYNDSDYLMIAAKEAIERTKFKPLLVNDAPYSGWVTIPIPFRFVNKEK